MISKSRYGLPGCFLIFLLLSYNIFSNAAAGEIEDSPYSYNAFGGIGLLDMRSARFTPDGTIAVGVHHDSPSTRYFSTWQATPWLETTLSYTDHRQESLGVDRSLDVKIRLLKEGDYIPQLAIGLQDALGSGRFGAEYLVASKRYYDFDFTIGFAWGYLGSRGGVGNMFRLFGDSFDERSLTTSSGGFRTGSYFAGQDMSFFAGVEYFPPIEGLSIKVEYSGVDTTKIADFTNLKRKTAFNVGINYKPVSWADISLGLDHGDRFTFRLTLKQNLHKLKFNRWFRGKEPSAIIERPKADKNVSPAMTRKFSGNDRDFDRLRRLGAVVENVEQSGNGIIYYVKPDKRGDRDDLLLLGALLQEHQRVTLHISHEEPQKYDATKISIMGKSALERFRKSAVYLREKQENEDTSDAERIIARSTYDAMARADLRPLSISIKPQVVEVKKETGPNQSDVKNIGRTARILTREMPDNVEKFTVISENSGLEISRVSVLRKDLEKANSYQGSPEEIWANSEISPPGNMENDGKDANEKSSTDLRFDWGVKPELLTHFGGNADGRFRADLYAKLYGAVQFMGKLKLSGELKQYILGNLDQIPLSGPSEIPPVRSNIARFARQGRTAIERLQLDYNSQIGRDIYARVTGGILESMFAGVGAELLYRPYDRNLALGVDVNWVKQRAFNQLFSFQDYDTLTGHATIYHENRTYNITSKLSAGRYLAGDYGATVDISRRFSNGVRIGIWATVTDMSSDDFGDGSFDKGIYLTMPLEIFWYRPSREKMRFNFRSLGKNGGQKLDRNDSLYDILSAGDKSRLARNWQEILD